MNKILTTYSIFFLATFSNIFAQENDYDFDNKTYITTGSIYIAEDDIFLFHEGLIIPIEYVSKDINGVFVILGADDKKATCGRCGEVYVRRQGHKCPKV